MVGPADYGLRTRRVGVLKREHQHRLSALTRLARRHRRGAARMLKSCNRSVGHKPNYFPPTRKPQRPTTLRAPAQQIVFRVYKRKPTQTPAPRHETRALLHRPVTGPHAHAALHSTTIDNNHSPQNTTTRRKCLRGRFTVHALRRSACLPDCRPLCWTLSSRYLQGGPWVSRSSCASPRRS